MKQQKFYFDLGRQHAYYGFGLIELNYWGLAPQALAAYQDGYATELEAFA